jgi:hypothetical protein
LVLIVLIFHPSLLSRQEKMSWTDSVEISETVTHCGRREALHICAGFYMFYLSRPLIPSACFHSYVLSF